MSLPVAWFRSSSTAHSSHPFCMSMPCPCHVHAVSLPPMSPRCLVRCLFLHDTLPLWSLVCLSRNPASCTQFTICVCFLWFPPHTRRHKHTCTDILSESRTSSDITNRLRGAGCRSGSALLKQHPHTSHDVHVPIQCTTAQSANTRNLMWPYLGSLCKP